LAKDKWEAIKKRCSGQIGSILELLQGKLSDHVLEIVADHKEGLFPHAKEIQFACTCPDLAGMCKHVAAVLYGIGNRLDHRPDLLFLLRGVDASELVTTQLTVDTKTSADQLDTEELGALFDIDIEAKPEKKYSPKEEKKKRTQPQQLSQKLLNFDTLTGKRLQALREERGLTVSAFAKALGVTPASIYRWEQSSAVLKLHTRSKKALNDCFIKQ
jgi:uncharacterized Zn finger protein